MLFFCLSKLKKKKRGSGNPVHDYLVDYIRSGLKSEGDWLYLSEDEFFFPEDKSVLFEHVPKFNPRYRDGNGRKLTRGIDIVGIRLANGGLPSILSYEIKTSGTNWMGIPSRSGLKTGLKQLRDFSRFCNGSRISSHICYFGGIIPVTDLDLLLDNGNFSEFYRGLRG